MSDPTKWNIEVGNSTVEFVIKEEIGSLENFTLVSGFYGIGKCGFIAVNHLVHNLGAKLIGYMLTDFLPPFLSVKDDRLVLPFELYVYEDILFLSAYFEPYKLEHRVFAKAIVSWVKSQKMKSVVLIGGLDSRLRTNEEVLAKAVYTKSYKSSFPNSKLPLMDEGLYITGPMALLLMFAEIEDFPAVGIMPYAERSRPDPIGASHAVEIVNDLLGTESGIEELIAEAESIENEIQSMEGIISEENLDEENRDRGMFL